MTPKLGVIPLIAGRAMAARALVLVAAALTAGCGLQVQSADLFLLQRSGAGGKLSLLVNDGGTIRCNGSAPRTLPGNLLIDARQLAQDLDQDAQNKVALSARAGVYSYTVKLQDGTIRFGDEAAARRPELGRAELFALQAAHGPCGLRST